MSNQINDQLKDRAWDLAVSMFDVTAPDEIIASVANKLYQEMLQEDAGQFTPDEPKKYLGGHFTPPTDEWMHQQEQNFINSFSE